MSKPADFTAEDVAARLGIRTRSFLCARHRGTYSIQARGSGPDRRKIYFRPADVETLLADIERERHFKRERDATICAAAESGVRYDTLASMFGLPLSSICRIAKTGGFRNRPRRSALVKVAAVRYARQHGFDEAACRFKVCRRALFNWSAKIGEEA